MGAAPAPLFAHPVVRQRPTSAASRSVGPRCDSDIRMLLARAPARHIGIRNGSFRIHAIRHPAWQARSPSAVRLDGQAPSLWTDVVAFPLGGCTGLEAVFPP